MAAKNLHYLFNVEYFEKKTKEENNALLNQGFTKDMANPMEIPGLDTQNPSYEALRFKTLYPGLLMGLGYRHELSDPFDDMEKDKDEEKDEAIKLGFSLDYVTGLPYIPGSTVKGMLRSVFMKEGENKEKIGVKYLNSVNPKITDDNAGELERQIFGAHVNSDMGTEDGSRGGDVFLDAWPIDVPEGGKFGGKLLALENITPHNKDDDRNKASLMNPVPLRLLKVPPGVIFLFRFILRDSEITVNEEKGTFSSSEKRDLFESILKDFGIGAKTNVGFGCLDSDTSTDRPYWLKQV